VDKLIKTINIYLVRIMKITCILLVLALVATSQNVEIITNVVNELKETEGVLNCILSKDTKHSIDSVTSFCGEEYANQSSCYSAYSNFKLCLINNKCQDNINAPTVHNHRFRLNWLAGIVGLIC